MDRSISVTTPESIAFSYELAGLGSRFLAVMIDLLIQIAIVVAIFAGLAMLASGASNVHEKSPGWIDAAAIAFIVIILFAVFFGYFILFEALSGGRTPGKMAMKIRVVRDGGYAVDFGGAMIRNLIRVAEVAFGFYAISAIVCLISPENKRLGDMAAGTIVVREARVAALAAIQSEATNTRAPLLSPQEQAIVDRFLARRDGLERNVRGLLAARIVDQIRPHLPEELRRLPDEDILERVSAW